MSKRAIKNKNNSQISKTSKKVVIEQGIIEEYKGLIPHPNIIERYEINCPGATDRILAMTENQLKTNQEIALAEQKNIAECRSIAIKEEAKTKQNGQLYGFILLLVTIIGCFLLIILDKPILGVAGLISATGLAIGSVIWNSSNKNK